MRDLWDKRFTPADAEVLKWKAKKLQRQRRFRDLDVEDIRQELALHTFQRTCRHDPARASRTTFVSRITDNALINMLEKRAAQKRDSRKDIHIERAPEDALCDRADSPEHADLKLDLDLVLNRMPAQLREIALLKGEQNVAEIARSLGLTREAVRHRLRQVQKLLTEAGLDLNQR